MFRQTISRILGGPQKRALKSKVNQAKQQIVRRWFSYDADQFHAALRRLGLNESDTILVHANFEPHSGFKGTPMELADALARFVGNTGNLLMVSIPFRGSAFDYLTLNKTFDVRKTISMMGLVTEMFRRRPGTLRSLHPTHPVLAFGKDAAWFVAGHEDCLYPCGPGSPFEKVAQKDGKILFFDVGFGAITFFHHVEHLLQESLPFPVYDSRLFDVPVIDATGGKRTVQTYAYSKQVPRSADKLEAEMLRQGRVRRGRIGNSRMLLVTAADVVACQTAMVKAGNYPYDVAV